MLIRKKVSLLKKKDFLEVANIDYDVIIDDIPHNDTSPIVTERLILFMLEMLKAYDEQEKKEGGLLNAAMLLLKSTMRRYGIAMKHLQSITAKGS